MIENRRRQMRERAKQQQEQEELALSDEKVDYTRNYFKNKCKILFCMFLFLNLIQDEDDDTGEDNAEEESEYETDESDNLPSFKPVFLTKEQRSTIAERDAKAALVEGLEAEKYKREEERKKDTHTLLANIVLRDLEAEKEQGLGQLDDDDKENDEIEYEAWKLRELTRIKRDRDEREALEKERFEIERIREMPDEEKRAYLEANPKIISNNAEKGEYKFLQKYYHRGAFYLDEDAAVLKRNVDQPTLDDHFDKV